MNALLHDIVHAWRNMLRQPATSLLIIVTLALGIGVNTAMFSMTWHVLLAPLPYTDGDRLVKLEQNEPGNGLENVGWSLPTLADLRNQNSTFSAVLQYFQTEYTLYDEEASFLVRAAIVDGDFLPILGVKPVLGRLLTVDDDRADAPPALLLGNRFWLESFGGSETIIGSTLTMNDIAYTIVGVLPAMPPYPRDNDVWVPEANDWIMSNDMVMNERREGLVSHVIAKLRTDVSLEQARQDIEMFSSRLRNSYPDYYQEESGYTIVLQPLKSSITSASARTVGLLMSLAALVVLIACANFANLTLAGMMRRSQELAVREAVGAAPGRIRRQLITENLLIALLGGTAGLMLTILGLRFVREFAAVHTPLASEIVLGVDVLWFCLALTLTTGLASALIASTQTGDINKALKEGGDKATATSGSKNLRNALLAAQVALAFVMLTSTALVTKSLYGLANQAIGYDTGGVVVLRTLMRYTDISGVQPGHRMMLQMLEETRALPGVQAAGMIRWPVLQADTFPFLPMPMVIEGGGQDGANRSILERWNIASQGFFDVLGIPLLAGRNFLERDDDNAPEAVLINERFAARYFPAQNALGQRLSLDRGNSWATIVGIVGDIRASGVDTPDTPMVYVNFRTTPIQDVNLYIKTRTDLLETAHAVAAIMQRLDPLQPIDSITPLDEVRSQWLAPTRLRTGLVAVFGILALVVTLSGVIGVVSYNIGQRVREIGVHMAMGASPASIRRLFIFQGLKIFLLGLLLGLMLMFAASPFIEPLLYETAALNPVVYLASALMLSLTVLLALYLPASRAARMDPVAALRSE